MSTSPTTAAIREYLKKNSKDRHWLADQIGVSKHTVDGWFAGREIPKSASLAIRKLIGGPPQVDVKISLSEWQRLSDKAAKEGISIDALIAAIVKDTDTGLRIQ